MMAGREQMGQFGRRAGGGGGFAGARPMKSVEGDGVLGLAVSGVAFMKI